MEPFSVGKGGMELIRQERRPPQWDLLIQNFPNKSLFHESAWLDYVVASYPGTSVDYFELRNGPEPLGYFCAIRVRRFGFSVWHGPKNTYMSPLVSPHVDQNKFAQLIVAACKKEWIAQLVLCDRWLDADPLKAAGFEQEIDVTHVCPLTGGAEAVWSRMVGTCRTRIRKAEKNNLVVEPATDPGFVDEFYSLFRRVLATKGRQPDYSIEQARNLFHHLGRGDRLFALRVKHQGQVIGTGLYPHDDRALYYWDAACNPDSLPLCPNNLLHWTAMKMAIERGIPQFDMGGGPQPSRFTQKFGGGLQPVSRYRKSFVPLLGEVQNAYQILKQKKLDAAKRWGSPPKP